MKKHVKYIHSEDVSWIQQVERTVQFVCSLEQCNGPQGSIKPYAANVDYRVSS